MPTDLTNIGIIDFAANSWSAGTILGGTIREASGLAIQKIYAANQATADRTATGPDWSVFTDLLLRHDIVLDYSMFFDSPIYGLATLSPYVGIRARIQIEGNYTFEQGFMGTPIALQNMQLMQNASGTSLGFGRVTRSSINRGIWQTTR